MPRLVASFVLASLFVCAPSIGAILIAAERPLTATGPLGEASDWRSGVSLAWNGSEGFLLWADSRPGGARVAIYGSRATAKGELLDGNGILLEDGYGEEWQTIAVAWVGDAWLALWHNGRSVRARRIGHDGSFLGPLTTVSNPRHFAMSARAVSNGDSIVVALPWAKVAFHVSGDLLTVREIPFPATSIDLDSLSTIGSEYLLVARGPHPGFLPLAVRISPAGVATERSVGPCERRTRTTRGFVTIEPGGAGDFWSVFTFGPDCSAGPARLVGPLPARAFSFEAGSSRQLFANDDGSVSVLWTGAVTPGQPVPLFVSRIDTEQFTATTTQVATLPAYSTVRVTPYAGGFAGLLPGLRLLFLTSSLELIGISDPPRIESLPAQYHQAMALDGSTDLVAFVESRRFGAERVAVANRGARARYLPDRGWTQHRPAIAGNGRTVVVTWFEKRATDWELLALTFSPDGEPLSHEPTHLASIRSRGFMPFRSWRYDANEIVYDTPSSIIWTGTAYLVAWTDGIAIKTARLLENGSLIDAEPRTLARSTDPQFQPVLARSDDVVLVAWVEGSITEPCQITCSGSASRIRAMRANADGFPIDDAPLQLSSEQYSTDVHVAVNGDVALVVWTTLGRGVRARSLVLHGSRAELQPFAIVMPGVAYNTRVAAHDAGFVVSWVEGYPPYGSDWTSAVKGMTVSRRGDRSAPFTIAPHERRPEFHTMWTLPNGKAAVAYERTAGDTGMVPRLFYVPIESETILPRRRAVR